MSNAERLLTALAPVFSGTEATVDEGVLDRLVAAVSSLADDEVTIAMVASADVEREFRGPPGLREAWKEDCTRSFLLHCGPVREGSSRRLVSSRRPATTR